MKDLLKTLSAAPNGPPMKAQSLASQTAWDRLK